MLCAHAVLLLAAVPKYVSIVTASENRSSVLSTCSEYWQYWSSTHVLTAVLLGTPAVLQGTAYSKSTLCTPVVLIVLQRSCRVLASTYGGEEQPGFRRERGANEPQHDRLEERPQPRVPAVELRQHGVPTGG